MARIGDLEGDPGPRAQVMPAERAAQRDVRGARGDGAVAERATAAAAHDPDAGPDRHRADRQRERAGEGPDDDAPDEQMVVDLDPTQAEGDDPRRARA